MKHLLLAACAAIGLWLLLGARTALAAEGVASPAHRSEHSTAQARTPERTGDKRVHEDSDHDSEVTQRGADRPAQAARRDDGVASKRRIGSATAAPREWHGQTGRATETVEDHGCGECGHPRASGEEVERQTDKTRDDEEAKSHIRPPAEPGDAHEVLGSQSLAHLPLKEEARATGQRSGIEGLAISGELTGGCRGGSCLNAVAAARPGVEAATRRVVSPVTLARTAGMAAASSIAPVPAGAVEPAAEGQVGTHIATAFQPTFTPDPGLQRTTRVGPGSRGGPADHHDRGGQTRLTDHLLTLAVLTGAAGSLLLALGWEMRLVLMGLLKGRGR